jgi:hypothetical protein
LVRLAHQIGLSESIDETYVLVGYCKSNNSHFNWISKNWYAVVDKVSKYLRIGSIVTFIGGLVGYFGFGVDTMTILKVSAMAYIISNVVACLKGLK